MIREHQQQEMSPRPLARILMCRPDHFRVAYKINPWMRNSVPVEPAKVQRQWVTLKSTLEKCGAKVEVMQGRPGVPDLVFTANAGSVRDNKVYLSHFYHRQRQPERDHNLKWFVDHGFEVFGETDVPFEGAGDTLIAGDKLFAAYGFRTDRKIYDRVETILGPFRKVVHCQLVDPRFYHLDTAFCPLSENLAIYYPEAFSKESRIAMENEIGLLAVPEQEAERFACNTVTVGGEHAVLPEGNVKTGEMLEMAGIQTHFVDVSEFLKAGGACKCLTLTLS